MWPTKQELAMHATMRQYPLSSILLTKRVSTHLACLLSCHPGHSLLMGSLQLSHGLFRRLEPALKPITALLPLLGHALEASMSLCKLLLFAGNSCRQLIFVSLCLLFQFFCQFRLCLQRTMTS